MSDTEPTDVSVSPSDPWQQQERELARIASEVLLANKTALFDALAAAGITTVIVNFDGCGDSGQIEMIEARAGDDDHPAASGRDRDRLGESGEAPRSTAKPGPWRRPSRRSSMTSSTKHMAAGKTTTAPTASTPSMSPNGPSRSTTTSGTWNPTIQCMCFEEAAMGHCYHHALSSVRIWGGSAEDYLPLHQWFDESKAITADFRHRALRHHAEGIFMLERFFGPTITLSTGRVVPVRLIGEQHVREDLGLHPELRRLGALHPARALDGPRPADPPQRRSLRLRRARRARWRSSRRRARPCRGSLKQPSFTSTNFRSERGSGPRLVSRNRPWRRLARMRLR